MCNIHNGYIQDRTFNIQVILFVGPSIAIAMGLAKILGVITTDEKS